MDSGGIDGRFFGAGAAAGDGFSRPKPRPASARGGAHGARRARPRQAALLPAAHCMCRRGRAADAHRLPALLLLA
jgi:hypothetical protein